MNTLSWFPGARRSHHVWALVSAVFLICGVSQIQAADTLIRTGSIWRYRDNGSDQGTAWRQTNFNDSAWSAGAAQLGFGEGDEATIVNSGPANGRYPTIYFRHTFSVTNRQNITNVALRILRDDGAVVFLNGVEVLRSNMPESLSVYGTWSAVPVAGSEENTFFAAAIPPALLRSGTNVMAVEVHQSDAGSSDLSFDFELLGNTPLGNLPPNATVSVTPSIVATGEVFAVSVAGSDPETAVMGIAGLQDGVTVRTFFADTGAFNWSNSVAGIHEYTTRATDLTGMVGTSPPERVLVTPPGYQQQSVFFPKFASADGLILQSAATVSSNVLHLHQPMASSRGAAWMATRQSVTGGFVNEFWFRITQKSGGGADGFSFIISGTPQPNIGSGGLSYGGITNSLAVEFDTWMNNTDGDPDGQHIGVHTRGLLANSLNESASIGSVTPPGDFTDNSGTIHKVRIHYVPGTLRVFLDNLVSPVLTVPVNLETLLTLPDGRAWIGLAGGTGASWENHAIWTWSHTSFANIPPVVRLTSPSQAVRVAPGTELTLTADASDPNGTVTALGFSVDGRFLDEIGEMSPFSLVLSNLTPGIHVVRAAAEDNDGVLALSAPPVVVEVVPTAAAVTLFPDFSSASNLALQGSAALLTNRLRLTPATSSQTGGAWLNNKQTVADGFETVFQFQVSQLSSKGADGFAFILFGSEIPLLGGAGAGLGYRSLTNSLAVEFDTYQNSETADLDGNHIGLHSRGLLPNSTDESASLARVTPSIDMSDGAVHTVVIRYDGAKLRVYLDDLILPVLDYAVNLSSLLSLDNGTAWVGFTSATGGEFENHDILMWLFRPNLRPHIQLTAPNAGPFFTGTNLIVSADAVDVDGEISGVQFFANENLIGAVSTAPFSISWSNAPAGTYVLTAIAFDDLGAATVSGPLTVSLLELRLQHHVRQNDGSITFDFATLKNRTYTVQYTSDLVHWSNAVPSTAGTGEVVQWQDTGPPVTASSPAAEAQRFYRLVLSP
ncbi:MAG TPA: Ig-like domain-containing protein [Candidatus Saccharimonadales bacterium]|nr:Ig-like domain-containing protein [Candidatus Saccharimonadales bacterium]